MVTSAWDWPPVMSKMSFLVIGAQKCVLKFFTQWPLPDLDFQWCPKHFFCVLSELIIQSINTINQGQQRSSSEIILEQHYRNGSLKFMNLHLIFIDKNLYIPSEVRLKIWVLKFLKMWFKIHLKIFSPDFTLAFYYFFFPVFPISQSPYELCAPVLWTSGLIQTVSKYSCRSDLKKNTFRCPSL